MKTQIIIDNIRTPITADDNEILSIARRKLQKNGISFVEGSLHLHKRSIDARKKQNITFVSSVVAQSDADVSMMKSESGIRYQPVSELSIENGKENLVDWHCRYKRPICKRRTRNQAPA